MIADAASSRQQGGTILTEDHIQLPRKVRVDLSIIVRNILSNILLSVMHSQVTGRWCSASRAGRGKSNADHKM